ncbi:hypothetical protein N8I77_006543 [Diaporthe amygdali]|uniref:Uncharacterized protein n=1 Tax=Phomopsis amygdali TaxID=1214568 RepID=A0AAD9W6P8_PHOAM|nr:hypothetical protein N8I77_006543 [Diaporthe amygdali]
MGDLSDADFERKFGFSREELREVEQKRLNEKNALEFGARMRGGFTTVSMEKAAKFLDKQEVCGDKKILTRFICIPDPANARFQAEEARQNKREEMSNCARWMWFMEPEAGVARPVEVIMDTGSGENFMTEGMAKDHKLPVQKLSSPVTFDLAVGEVTCQYRVEVSWMGAGNEHGIAEFYLLPPDDPRIDKPLLGRDSIQEFRDLLLTERPRKAIAYTAMKKKTTQDDIRAQQVREQAMADRTRLARDRERYQKDKDEKRRDKGSQSKEKK